MVTYDKKEIKGKFMDIIRTIASGFRFLAGKVTKKERRTCAVFIIGAVVIGAAAFTSHVIGSGGKNSVLADADTKSPPGEVEEDSEEPNNLSGVGGVISGVLVTQNANGEIRRIGTSYEAVLVGQRTAAQEKASPIIAGKEIEESVKSLEMYSVTAASSSTRMSDEDYETLLAIVEAEAGGEDTKGRILVANVIFNRMNDDRFPNTVTEIVWEKVSDVPQFTPTADGRINTVTVSEETREAVNRAIDGEDYSQGALFFVAKEEAEQYNVQWFESELKKLFKHGTHDFYTYP